jgi:hypothetical protein
MLNLFSFVLSCSFLIERVKIIKNGNIPSCKNCIYFRPEWYSDEFSGSFAKCEKFGEKNIISGEINYEYADLCRKDESKCGHEATYFEKEKFINFKIIKHKLISNVPRNIFILTILFYCFTIASLKSR